MEKYIKVKFPNNYDFINRAARNAFSNKKVTSSIIAYSHGYNHYSLREALINKNNIGCECPRCGETETWDHVVKCSKTIELRKDYIFELTKELLKYRNEQVEVTEIFDIVEDIMVYLENGDAEEYETM